MYGIIGGLAINNIGNHNIINAECRLNKYSELRMREKVGI